MENINIKISEQQQQFIYNALMSYGNKLIKTSRELVMENDMQKLMTERAKQAWETAKNIIEQKDNEEQIIDKKIIVITHEGELETVIEVSVLDINRVYDAVEEAKERYFDKDGEEWHDGIFEDVLNHVMDEYKIKFDYIIYEEI